MIEFDVYYFYWLSMAVTPLEKIQPGVPWVAVGQQLIWAKTALQGTEKINRAFPRTASVAKEILEIIDSVMPPMNTPPELADVNKAFSQFQTERLRVLATNVPAALRDGAKHAYILKIEDVRCLSAHSLVEEIENCFSLDAWKIVGRDAKRELEESGKCLAFERYTAAGFHALRGVECVIRQYIEALTGSLPTKRDWGSYIDVLKRNGADPKLTAVLDNIRTLDRNPLMHPEDWLDVDEAVGIFTVSQTAIGRLVTGIASKKGSPRP